MSKLFYDHLIEFEEVEIELKKLELTREERHELERLIDSMVHHKVVGRILTHLSAEHHEEFLDRYHKKPYDPTLLAWINQRIEDSVEKHVKQEIQELKKELLEDIRSSKKAKK